MQRHKWHQSQPNIKVNDIVLIATDNLPPTQWALGRVTTVIPGDDGHVRVAEVSSRGNTYRRPIAKLCLLPIEENSEPPGDHVQN